MIAAGTACPCGRNHDQSRKALAELLSQSKLLMDAELAIDESGRRSYWAYISGARRPVPGCYGPRAVQNPAPGPMGPPIIMRYAAAAPLQAVTGDFRRLRQQASLDDVIKEVRDQLKKAGPERKQIADLP